LKSQVCIDLLTTAIQGGGSAYWANDYSNLKETRNEKHETIEFRIGNPLDSSLPLPTRNLVTVTDIENAICYISQEARNPLNHELGPAYKRIIKDIVENSDDDGCSSDAEIADVVLQIAIFGEIIFG
jgi:hypothetical protein